MAAPPPSSPPIRAVARGASWMLPASLLGNAARLGLDVYTNGLLSTEDYGLYAAARRVAQLLAFVVLLGMENAVIRAVATARDDAGARGAVRLAVAWTFGASVLVGVLGLGVLRPFAAWIDPGPAAATVLGLGLLSLPLAAFRTVAVSAAQGRGQLRDRAVVMFVAWPLAQLVGLWWLVGVGGRGVVGAMAGANAPLSAPRPTPKSGTRLATGPYTPASSTEPRPASSTWSAHV